MLQDPAPTLIGWVGPKAPPDGEGNVEIAFGVVPSHEERGYATEATKALLDWIERDPRTRRIVAETPLGKAASHAVLEKCGLSFLGEGAHPGTIRFGRSVNR